MSSNNTNDYDKLSDAELHNRLKAAGFDLPVSINRGFLIRKLQQAEGHKSGGNNGNSHATDTARSKRLSLNVPVQSPVTPNTRLARNSISSNSNHHQLPPNQQPMPKPPIPTAPPTPPRNHKQLTPPRQTAKPVTPPPSPPRKQKAKQPPTPPRVQKVPFTSKYVTVNEDESEEEEEPTPPPKSFRGLAVARKSNSFTTLQVREPTPTPPVQLSGLPSDGVEKYMKLFNDPKTSPVFMRGGRRSGKYSSDDDDSGDEIRNRTNLKPKNLANSVSRRIDWDKYKAYVASNMPCASNALVYLSIACFIGLFGYYSAFKSQLVWNTIFYISIVAVFAFMAFGFHLGYSARQQRKLDNEKKLFAMVDNILGLLQEHHENSQATNDPPMAIQHIRDNLIQHSERTPEKMDVWNKAIEYILNNESRVREEMQHIRGEEYRCLKWLSTISPKRGNSIGGGWQGPAFEIIDGSPNSLPLKIPTNCLKVRHMYDTKSPLTEEVKAKIQASLSTKLGIELKHIGFDNHNDCCVYIKCYKKEDAKNAYVNLHGWWYNGKLLSVKFLREERYNTRFPDSATM